MSSETSLVPIISLENYDENKGEIAKKIQNACETIGFFYLHRHGLENEVNTMLKYSRTMFTGLSLDQKRTFQHGYTSGNRGYCVNGEEELQKGIKDSKEAFNVCRTETDDGISYWPKPEFLPEQIRETFRSNTQQFFNTCHEFVMKKVLNCLALGLHLDENFFQLNYSEKAHTLRLLHYPPLDHSIEDEEVVVAGEHSDYGTITLLFQDQVGGLQVRDLQGNWVDVEPIQDTIVVNIADLLQKWTDGKYVSTKHRVVQRKNSRTDRYSIAYFVHPNTDTMVKDMTAGDYLQMRLHDTHKY